MYSRSKKAPGRYRAGMSLVELLAALAVMAIGVAALMDSISYAHLLIADQRQRGVALRLLEQKVETLQDMNVSLIGMHVETATVASVAYTLGVTSALVSPPDERFKRVSVTVQWSNPWRRNVGAGREFLVINYRQ